jgi:hypothetical protein
MSTEHWGKADEFKLAIGMFGLRFQRMVNVVVVVG